MNDDPARLAADLVCWRSQGVCPLDGPCADCDCFDSHHELERAEAAWLVARGWHLAAGGLRPRLVAEAPGGPP